ncbi:MAG: Serine/threonine-protein kinase PknB [Planctomycetota bacterium]|jgi:hypothetical protein
MGGESGNQDGGAAPPDAVVLTRAVERGLITSDQARTIAERTVTGATAADLLVTNGLLTRQLVDTLGREHGGASTTHGTPKSIAGFDLGEVLGEGGMGCVYRAVQRSLGRQVALKVIGGQFAKDAEFSERFLREARAAGAISHPNVITCFDVGISGDRLYMALELVTGGDAAQLAKRCGGHLPEVRAVEIVADATRGLCAVARAGLIHRDIKPSNIFITEDGVAKLADLGLARTTAGDDRMTVTGRALGTPAFMSPEQARGDADVDIRSDIYALGATLYALVAGRAPFEGTSPWVVVAKVLNDEPVDPRTVVKTIPDGVVKVALRAMAKDRAQRYPTPEHFLTDLERLLAGQAPLLDQVQPSTNAMRRPASTMATIAVGAAPPASRRGPMLAIAAAAVAAVAVVAALTLVRGGAPGGGVATGPGSATAAAQSPGAVAARAGTPGDGQASAVRSAPTPPPPPPIPPEAIATARLLAQRLIPVAGLSATAIALPDGSLAVRGLGKDFRDLSLLSGQPVSALSLAGCRRIDDLRPLAGLPLRDLDLTGLDAIDDLRGLESAPLQRLVLDGCDDLDGDLSLLAGKPITSLVLRGCSSLSRLTGIEGFALTELDMSGCTGIRTDLVALHGMPLRRLVARGSGITSLTGLAGLPLRTLDLAGCTRLVRIDGIRDLPVEDLNLGGCTRIAPDPDSGSGQPRSAVLAELPRASLTRLSLSGWSWLTDLSPLAGSRIQHLDLSGCSGLEGDLASLTGLPLQALDLSRCTGLTSLSGVVATPLKRLVVTDAGAIAADQVLRPFMGRPGLIIVR